MILDNLAITTSFSGNLIQVRLKPDNRAPHANMSLEDQFKFYEYYPKLVELSKVSVSYNVLVLS